MSYKLLRQDCHPDNWSVLCVEDFDVPALNRGMPLHDPQPVARVTLSAFGQQACDFLESPCPIVSDRMRRAIERAGVDNVQWFPAELRVETLNTMHHGFWALNVVGKLACVDIQASDVEQDDDGRIIELRSFRCDALRTYDMSLFRLAEDPRAIILSSRLQNLMQAAGLRGVLLQDPSTYDRGLPVSSLERSGE